MNICNGQALSEYEVKRYKQITQKGRSGKREREGEKRIKRGWRRKRKQNR